jgi:hypothetical protein
MVVGCIHELSTAKASGIPIICVIDQDRFQQVSTRFSAWLTQCDVCCVHQRSIISQYQELGFGHIFSEQVTLIFSFSNETSIIAREQVVGYTGEHRKVAFEKISKGIVRAVAAQNIKAVVKMKKTKPSAPKIHKDRTDNDQLFRQLVLKHYTDAGSAFTVFQGDDGLIGRKNFKKLVRSVGMKIDEDNRKQLRKRITSKKAIDRGSFMVFFGSESSTKAGFLSSSNTDGLAALPTEGNESYIIHVAVVLLRCIWLLRLSVPELPAAFRERGYAQQQLMEALLDSAGARSTAVTAPKSRISSQVRENRVL